MRNLSDSTCDFAVRRYFSTTDISIFNDFIDILNSVNDVTYFK